MLVIMCLLVFNVTNAQLSHVNNTAVVNATSEMPISRDSLSELRLTSFVDCNKQSVVTFMRDLDMYFELKKVPENLKIPPVLRADRTFCSKLD